MERLKKILAGLLLIVLGAGIGYFAKPTKVVTKVEIKEVIKEVVKTETQKDTTTTKKKVTRPDGTVEEEEKTENRDRITEESKKESERSSSNTNITYNNIGLNVSVLAIKDATSFRDKTEYGIFVKKRVFSSITVSAMATTDKKVGLGLGLDF